MAWQETLSWPRLVVFLTLVFLLITFADPFTRRKYHDLAPEESEIIDKDTDLWCPPPRIAVSPDDGLASSTVLVEQTYLDLQVKRLSAAVNVPTVSHGNAGLVDEEQGQKAFDQLHVVLNDLFPLV